MFLHTIEETKMNEPEQTNEYEPLEMKIVLEKSGNYRLQKFSMKHLKALEEWHKKHHLPRKWKLTQDEKTLTLL